MIFDVLRHTEIKPTHQLNQFAQGGAQAQRWLVPKK